MLTLLALILPLSLDTFAISAALGVARMTPRERWRLTLVFALAEATMPLIGYGIGTLGTFVAGGAADVLAIGVLAVAGIVLLRGGEEEHPERLIGRRGWPLLAAALAISLDELAIGVTIGLLRLPILWVTLLIGLQAIVASQLGARLGSRLGDKLGEWAERAAGMLLLLIAAGLLASKVAGVGV